VSTTPVTHMPKTHSKENVALLKLENYLRNSHSIIQQAQALQNKDARYIMNYQELKRDISDIANSINDYVNRDTQDQNPRYFRPLTKRYY
jgi:RAQPRD family integrative conjugative element protein